MLKSIIAFLLCVLALATFLPPGQAQELAVGATAPAISVSEFLQGETITAFETNQTYAVVFWASWNASARAALSQISVLQQRFPNTRFLAVSIWEHEPERPKTFLQQNRAKVTCSIALDAVEEGSKTADGFMSRTWMDAASQSHLLTTFLIDGRGKIAWIGPLGDLENPLEQVLSGTWDRVAAATAFWERVVREQRIAETKRRFLAAQKAQDGEQAVTILDTAIKEDPTLERLFGLLKYQTLLQYNETDADTFGRRLVEEVFINDAASLNQIAWHIVDPENRRKPTKGQIALALLAARRADELCKGKDPAVCDTLAKAYFDNKDFKMACATQERGMALARGTDFASNKAIQARLALYRKAAKH